jgi:hypothetical protein
MKLLSLLEHPLLERRDKPEKTLRVECYSGYKGDERPLRVHLAQGTVEIAEIEDRWYSPGATYFRVMLANSDRYVLRRDDAQDVWTLQAFRASAR